MAQAAKLTLHQQPLEKLERYLDRRQKIVLQPKTQHPQMKYPNMEWHTDRRLAIDVNEGELPLLVNQLSLKYTARSIYHRVWY